MGQKSVAAGTASQEREASPFLKWAGGKGQLLEKLLERAPKSFGTYFEPFLGGAALFYGLKPVRAVLGDALAPLVASYVSVRDDVEEVIARLKRMPYDETFYYKTRKKRLDVMGDVELAAWVIYMNKAGYNGLWRVNKKGGFNVPFGRHTNPTICNAPVLRACSAALKGVRINHGDFAVTVRDARKGDFVYFDPPYVPKSVTADFTSYTADGFGHAEQVRLRDTALSLKRMGVHVMLSNHDLPIVRKLYQGFKIEHFDVRRRINRNAADRGPVGEVIIT